MDADRDATRLVVVARFDYPYQAHLALAQLEAAGIPAVLADEHTIGANMFYSQALGGVKLKVSENRKSEALEILSQAALADEAEEEAPALEERPVCPKCGSKDVSYRRHNGALSLFIPILLLVPFLAIGERYTCQTCGVIWKEK